MAFILNGAAHDIPPNWAEEPLLFLLREHFGLAGAKFGCGEDFRGALGGCFADERAGTLSDPYSDLRDCAATRAFASIREATGRQVVDTRSRRPSSNSGNSRRSSRTVSAS